MIQAIDPKTIRQQTSSGVRGATVDDFSAVLAASNPTATSAVGVYGGQMPAAVTNASIVGVSGGVNTMNGGWSIPGANPYMGTGYPGGSGVGYVPPFASGVGAGAGATVGTGLAGSAGIPSEINQAIVLMRDTNMQMIAVQADVQQVNREFSTLSNILKSKHDTERIAIQNMRVA